MYLAINQLFLLVKKLESCGISFYFGLLSRVCRICIRRNFFYFPEEITIIFLLCWGNFLWKEMTFLHVSVSLYCRNSENYEETIHRKECLFTWFNTVYNFNFSDFICWIKIVMSFHIFEFFVLTSFDFLKIFISFIISCLFIFW